MKIRSSKILILKQFICFIFILSTTNGIGQNKFKFGHIPYKNFPRNIYNGQQQNFGIIETDENTILVANKNAIYEYNGNTWTKVETDKDSTISPKILHKTKNGKILVGGEFDFGYLDYKSNGKLQYHSISSKINDKQIGIVWNIYENSNYAYFIGSKAIFIYKDKKIETIKYPEGFSVDNSNQIGENLVFSFYRPESKNSDNAHYHYSFNSETKKFSKLFPEIIEFQQLKALKYVGKWKNDQNYLIINQKGQAFSINQKTKEFFKLSEFELGLNDNIIHIADQEGLLIFSTEKNGIIIFDKLGQLIRKINDKDGLIDNNVNYSYLDNQKNLWCSTVNGISFLELSSPVSFFGKSDGLTSKLEDITFYKDKILIASADINYLEKAKARKGFKEFGFGQPSFSFTKTQIDGEEKILIVGYDGIYSINESMKLEEQIPSFYAWKIIQSQKDTNRIYIGTETDGVASAYWDGSKFKFETLYPNTGELIRSMVEFKGEIYFGLSNIGLAKLDTSKSQKENLLPGLKSQNLKDFYLTIFNDTLFVGTTDGLYYLNHTKDKLLPFDKFNLTEKNLYVHRIFNENNKRLWLVLFYNSDSDQEKPVFGYLEKDEKGKWQFITKPFRYFSNDIVQGLAIDEKGYIWLGADAQTYIVNLDQTKQLESTFKININHFSAGDRKSEFHNFKKFTEDLPDYEFENNTIRIDISAQSYYGQGQNAYRFKITGDKKWSDWSDLNWKEYQNLPEGTYTIQVQAKDYYENESEILEITFTILPPWYRTWWAYILYVIITIGIIYGLIILSLHRVKEQKKKLEKIVKERTTEIAKQNEVLAEQKDEIEVKNKDILDSIKYAKRIQDSILPPKNKMKKMFTDYFVLFKPKDIVSGDFYWAEKIEEKSLFAAVDCTGHGVPGAMVSVVGNNGLNRSVKEFNLKKPGKILDQLREIVIDAFNAQNNMDVKDGMDIALCSVDYKNMKVEFSGANNPMIIIRNGEILETKADKQPIGQFINKTPFTNHTVDIQKGDTIYVYTDGYVDQFGGEKGKKLKSRPFKNLLLELSQLPMSEQHKILNEKFENWRGKFEQIDDVCVFGVKI